MLKGFFGILLFVFFVIVFILLLVGGYLIRTFKDFRKAVQQAADMKEQRNRDEIGRQRQQYSQKANKANKPNEPNEPNKPHEPYEPHEANRPYEPHESYEPSKEARRTQTATGETIIDHHHEQRESRKIFDDADGEYTEFEEIKS